MKTILVTGAGGYLGGYLIDRLSTIGKFKVLAFDLGKENMQKRFFGIKNIDFYDYPEWELGNIPFEKTDIVINCAFARVLDGRELVKSLEFANKLFIKSSLSQCSIVNISSRSVYGQNAETPWTEKTDLEPNSLYALAKYCSELLLNNTIFHYPNVYSSNIRLAGLSGFNLDQRVTSRFVDNIINNEPIKITGGKQSFSYLDVRDAADGIISLLSIRPDMWKSVYNLGPNRVYSIVQIAHLVNEVAKKYFFSPVKILIEEKDIYLKDEMDSTPFLNETGWKPQYEIQSTIESIFEFKIQQNTYKLKQ
jgi:nucleoside-diphosphate-sugar epimerase